MAKTEETLKLEHYIWNITSGCLLRRQAHLVALK